MSIGETNGLYDVLCLRNMGICEHIFFNTLSRSLIIQATTYDFKMEYTPQRVPLSFVSETVVQALRGTTLYLAWTRNDGTYLATFDVTRHEIARGPILLSRVGGTPCCLLVHDSANVVVVMSGSAPVTVIAANSTTLDVVGVKVCSFEDKGPHLQHLCLEHFYDLPT